MWGTTYHMTFDLELADINEVCRHICYILDGFFLAPMVIKYTVIDVKFLVPDRFFMKIFHCCFLHNVLYVRVRQRIQ